MKYFYGPRLGVGVGHREEEESEGLGVEKYCSLSQSREKYPLSLALYGGLLREGLDKDISEWLGMQVCLRAWPAREGLSS